MKLSELHLYNNPVSKSSLSSIPMNIVLSLPHAETNSLDADKLIYGLPQKHSS